MKKTKTVEPTKIFIDFETQSNNDIRLGVNHYMSCPGFRAYLLSYSIDREKIITLENTWMPNAIQNNRSSFSIPKELPAVFKSGNYLVISHNTNFDVSVWNKIFPSLQIDWKKTFDTSWFCRVLSVPASLDKASDFFKLLEGKDKAGKAILKKYYTVKDIPGSDLTRLIEYNRQDVKALIELYDVLAKNGYALEGNEFIYELVQKQNEINIDKAKLNELAYLKREIIVKTEEKSKKLFPTYKKSGEKELVSIARSANEIKKYLAVNGVKLPSISKNKIEEELNLQGVKLDSECQNLINLYRVLQAKGLSKYDTFMEYFPNREKLKQKDYFIKDFQISHGTHTGRPAGRGLQLHNISRPPKKIENLTSPEIIQGVKNLIKHEDYLEASKELSAVIWSCMIPDNSKHVISRYDLSSIEPRVGAFLRRDEKTLETFRLADAGKGKDLYTQYGEKMNFPKDIARQLSKVIVLAADYGQGANGLRASMIKEGLPDMGYGKAKLLVGAYHAANPGIKKAWYELGKKFALAVLSGYSEYNAIEFKREIIGGKKFIAVILPSGRSKYYADVSFSNGKVFYCDSRLGKIELRPYLLYENLVQASATDVLFLKAAKVEQLKDVNIKLTIYDELITSNPLKISKDIKKTMGEEEEAYAGMPISFKGGESSTFWKGDKVK